MKVKQLRFAEGFRVSLNNPRSQAAEMVIQPGDSEGGPDNRHPESDQWLYVVSGDGEAIVGGKSNRLAAGMLLLIERGETHEVRNTGDTPLETLNLYVPPAYK